MNPVMQTLRDLSDLDTQLRMVARRRDEKIAAEAEAEQGVVEADATCAAKKDEVAKLQKEADAMNLEVKSHEDNIAKIEDQQRKAKSNKEYDIFKREIEAAKEKISVLEDGVLERLERIDAVRVEEKAAQEKLDAAKKTLAAAKKDLAEAEKSISGEEEKLNAQRTEVADKLDPELRHTYERLLNQRKDTALALVRGGVCTLCMRKITRQMEAMLDIGEEIVTCMSCARILYVDETS